jgi:hypothetical protein
VSAASKTMLFDATRTTRVPAGCIDRRRTAVRRPNCIPDLTVFDSASVARVAFWLHAAGSSERHCPQRRALSFWPATVRLRLPSELPERRLAAIIRTQTAANLISPNFGFRLRDPRAPP